MTMQSEETTLDDIDIVTIERIAAHLERVYKPVTLTHPKMVPTSMGEAVLVAFGMGQASIAAGLREHVAARIRRATNTE